MRENEKPFSYAPFRIMAVLLGALSLAMGREAMSRGYFWNSGYNARIGSQTTGTTLSWMLIGGLLILAGIFPWQWLFKGERH